MSKSRIRGNHWLPTKLLTLFLDATVVAQLRGLLADKSGKKFKSPKPTEVTHQSGI